jgi:hypothetical protein
MRIWEFAKQFLILTAPMKDKDGRDIYWPCNHCEINIFRDDTGNQEICDDCEFNRNAKVKDETSGL